ncbi:PAS domain S-box protein [Halomontanus rarus]|uniref:PAS domain S-box protein n=1 Tax=Halomontanus rarus TaxID=3034020 RepID=UPI0023E773F6|nr:PAS domain S-box protein [Halovivax sp. TS33]
MNVGPESREATHLRRLLVVSATPWVQTAAHALEDADEAESITVDVVESDGGFDLGSLANDGSRVDERPDCVLTDDADVVHTGDIDAPLPLVFAVDSPTSTALESVPEGVTEVVTRTETDAATPALLRHRLERAVECAHARRTLADREAWYRTLIERSSTLLLVLDEERRRRFVSPSVQRIVGCEPSDMLGERVDEVLHPDDRATFVEVFDEVSKQGPGATATCTYRIRHADDSWHVHEASLTNHFEDPTVGGVVVSIHDVTDYRRSKPDQNEAFERVSDAFVALDTEWRFTYVNDRAEELFDVDADDLVGRSFDDIAPELEGTELRRKAREAFDTQEPDTIDTYVEPYDLWVEARFYPSPTGLSISVTETTVETARNVTPEEQDHTERLQTLVENVPVDLFVLDSDGTFTLSGGNGLETIGLESDDVVGESIFDVVDDPQIHADVRRALDGDPVHTQQSTENRFFESWYQPVTEDDEVECVIGVGIDVTERSQYERALETIQKATTKQLLTVESSTDALEYVVDVATNVLEGTDVVCYRFDERANELVPAAYSTAERPVGVRPTESPIWDVFVREMPQTFDDVDVDIVPSADEGRDGSTAFQSGLSVSLGEHGVLVVASPDPDRYVSGAEAVDLALLLAATAEAALDRIERSQRLRERERELDEQNTRLERLGRASRIREDLEELLLRADSREEIERGICDRLLELDECQFAWIGEPDPGGNRVVPRETAGHGDSYLEAVTVTTVDDPATEPTGACVRSREVVSVENVADGIRNGAWRAEALSRNFQSILSIPLLYDGFLYGVLSVYADRHDGFDEPTRTVLEELGETIAYTIDAVQRKNALVSDDVIELELEFEAESAFTTLAERFETTVTLEGTIPQTDDSTITFLTLETGVDSDDLGEIDGFESVTPLRVSDDRTLVQARLTGPFFGTTVENYGGSLRALTIDESGTRAIVDVPRSVEVRELLTGISRSGPDVSLRAKHDRTRSRDNDHDRVLENHGQHPLLEELTDRQREVVQAAYHGGFFEWPRTATGEEVAASLDISPPAFHNHVRSVQRKVFASLFETDPIEEH